ncbi:MAG: alpha/beta hydrolase [Methanobrevibacter sp.]|uniref:alpha/beta hydrolase n=1 Tax=Methanobrevibacter sp. TaxID=66852 RepID=UPI0025E920AE|nr:alpha/beta hydrolase [Methanobrevibacter sp.]MBQ6099448.1 alpha/beta hydrolase [Methanobrevibacter sp.]
MNKFGLVYNGAIEENIEGKVNIKPVNYEVSNVKVSGNLYLPSEFDESKKYSAISVAHPNGGCKEQVAGLYAQKLAELGYVTLASDARYQGASEGEPRNRDYPENRIEDVSGMVDYLTSLDFVDTNKIGSLGICGGAGYTLASAQQDKRIKAVAVLSMFNTGRVRRNGFLDSDISGIGERLQKGAEARNKLLKGEVIYEGDNPEMTEEETRKMMESLPEGLYRDGVEYYGITHKHPNSNSRFTTESLPKVMAFDVDDRMDLITQPLLMMAGSSADTKYMTDSAFEKAINAENKELFLIDGASHIQTYWVDEYIIQVTDKLEEFFKSNL